MRVGAPQGLGLQGSVGCTVSGRLERGSVNKGLQGEPVPYDDKRNMLLMSLASPSVCEERVKLDMLVGCFGGKKGIFWVAQVLCWLGVSALRWLGVSALCWFGVSALRWRGVSALCWLGVSALRWFGVSALRWLAR